MRFRKTASTRRASAADVIVEDVKWLRYTKILLKTDNEPAILKLLVESLRELRIHGLEEVTSENSPEYDSQANGNAEIGMRTVEDMLRTHTSGIEDELGYRAPARHPLMAWLVRPAATAVAWSTKGPDGLTAYQRARSNTFRTRLLISGEMC